MTRRRPNRSLVVLMTSSMLGLIAGYFLGHHDGSPSTMPVVVARAEFLNETDQHRFEDPLAIADGRTITGEHMHALVMETAGGAILEEVLLDRALQRRCREAGFTIDQGRVSAERLRLMRTLDPNPQVSAQLLDALRARRSLGTRRFDLFLKRNAMLRALIQDDVVITDEMLQVRYEFEFGMRYRVRVLMHDNAAELRRLQKRIESGESFADLAAQHSTDISGDRGGLISDLSAADARYPESVRRAVETLTPGQMSSIVSLDSGYAIVKLEARVPSRETPSFDTVRADLDRAVRLEQERFLMDSLATQLVRSMDVSVLDPALHESWERLRRSGR